MQTRQRLISRVGIIALSLLVAITNVATGNQGDVVKRYTLPGACIQAPVGVAFDGKTVYYTSRADIVTGVVRRLTAATGADEGSLAVTLGGNPLPTGLAGLEYDANRGVVWAGAADHAYAVSVATGEVVMDLVSTDMNGIRAIGYDPFKDVVWETDSSECYGWYATGETYGPGAFGDRGLSFDGVDMWQNTAGMLPVPAPRVTGLIYPTDLVAKIDFTRIIDPPGQNYNDIAYDCVTFPVPVVWVANNLACELIAFEVQAKGPCLRAPAKRLLRGVLADTELPLRTAKLPLVTSWSDRVWRVEGTTQVDDSVGSIVQETTRPLVFYRLLGQGDADLGNILKAVKDPTGAFVMLRE